jgi:molybdenum cofactor biosynthesis protein B
MAETRSKTDESRSFIPVRIAVLTFGRCLACRQIRRQTLADPIAEAGHILSARDIVTDDRDKIRDKFCVVAGQGYRCRHHHWRHGLHRPRRDAGSAGANLRKAHGRLSECSIASPTNKIGASTIQSRATGGVVNATFVFVLPGSPGLCRDAWDGILKPQLDYRHMPCNFVDHARWTSICAAAARNRRGLMAVRKRRSRETHFSG